MYKWHTSQTNCRDYIVSLICSMSFQHSIGNFVSQVAVSEMPVRRWSDERNVACLSLALVFIDMFAVVSADGDDAQRTTCSTARAIATQRHESVVCHLTDVASGCSRASRPARSCRRRRRSQPFITGELSSAVTVESIIRCWPPARRAFDTAARRAPAPTPSKDRLNPADH